MKTKITLLVIFLAISTSMIAQKQFGIIAGLGQSNIDNYKNYKIFLHHGVNDPLVVQNSFSKQLSWNFGAYYNQSLPFKHLSTHIEFVLKGMGASYYFVPNEGSDYDTIISSGEYKLMYLSIPIQLQYNIQDYWYLKTGIDTHIRLQRVDNNFEDARPITFGASVAFGLTLFPKLDIVIEAYHDLTRMNKTANSDEFDARLFNSSLTVSLKYELWKKK